MSEPILIWGAGAIGGTIGSVWARAGIDVLLVDRVADHVEACRREGLALEGPVASFKVVVPATTPEALRGRFGRVVLAVKAQDTEAALEALGPHLAPDGLVLSAQNGLNEIAIAARLGEERTVGCFVNFGADWLGPGRILYGNRGAVVVGELDGAIRERTLALFELLQLFEPDAVVTDNIWGYLWGKLAYGAMLFGTALTADSMADNFADPERRPAWLALGREVMAVAAARGIRPVGFGAFEPAAFMPGAPDEAAVAALAWLDGYNRASAKSHSGIYRDLAVRRRRTEVDAQIGVVATLARQNGIPTPALDRLVALIHDVEDGRRPLSRETLAELIAVC